jgi:hypothetical protein
MKKYEKNQYDLDLKTKYKFIVKTGPGQYAGTNANVIRPQPNNVIISFI